MAPSNQYFKLPVWEEGKTLIINSPAANFPQGQSIVIFPNLLTQDIQGIGGNGLGEPYQAYGGEMVTIQAVRAADGLKENWFAVNAPAEIAIIGSDTGRVSFYGGIARTQLVLNSPATDPASTQNLVNNIRESLGINGVNLFS